MSDPNAHLQVTAAVFGRCEITGTNWKRTICAIRDDGSIDRTLASGLLLKFADSVEL